MSGPYPKITYNGESDRFYYDWHRVIRPATEQEIAGAMERLSAFEHEHDALLRGRIPTHRCKICGALWIFWPAGAAGMTEASWSLFSLRCYKCCDCAPMGEQIEPLPRLGALSGEPASAHETTASPQAPIARVVVGEDGCHSVSLYAPGLPPGAHDLYCEPEAVAPMMRESSVKAGEGR